MKVMNMTNKLVEWVMNYVEEWRDHRDQNYLEDWKEYERIWRGEWAAQDKQRQSERSRITSPATQQAIESHQAEIEEAVFGQGDYLFDIEDDMMDQDPRDVEYLKAYMKESFKKDKVRKNVGDSILLASIYGTGVAEVIVKKVKELVPATQPMPDVGAVAIGVQEKSRISVYPKPVNPQNFLIDPTASSIDDAMGVAIEEFVSSFAVAQKIQEGAYKDDQELSDDAAPNDDLEPTWVEDAPKDDRVHLIRYYGLVPKSLLEAQGEGEVEEIFPENQSELVNEYGDMVEAVVVIADKSKLLKAEKNPYMMQDRPVVAYQDDSIPNKFWGRGVAEKAYNMQKAIDAQLRSHMDSLALTTVPMIAMDATRLPRGSKFEVTPGKAILTNGNPGEIMMPFNFGQTSPANIETAGKFEQMLLQATGTLDTAALQQGQAEGGSLSLALSGVIKKNKRTLVNFQDQFLIPFIEKAAWRFMQFDPENFPVKDWKFVPSSTLGMLAKEVEQAHVFNMLKTLGPDSPLTPILMMAVVQNSNLPNKSALVNQIQQSMQPNPQADQMAQLGQVAQLKVVEAQINDLNASAMEKQARAQKTMTEAQLAPQETQAKMVSALSTNLSESPDDKAFKKRVEIANLMLKEKDLNQKAVDSAKNAEIVKMQMENQK